MAHIVGRLILGYWQAKKPVNEMGKASNTGKRELRNLNLTSEKRRKVNKDLTSLRLGRTNPCFKPGSGLGTPVLPI